jgi:hypothetical protein
MWKWESFLVGETGNDFSIREHDFSSALICGALVING